MSLLGSPIKIILFCSGSMVKSEKKLKKIKINNFLKFINSTEPNKFFHQIYNKDKNVKVKNEMQPMIGNCSLRNQPAKPNFEAYTKFSKILNKDCKKK